MFDPQSLRQLIAEHGVTVNLSKKTPSSYNITTGTVTETTTTYSVKAYFFNNDPSVGEFSTTFNDERRLVVSDILENGSVTPDIAANDEISGFGDTVKVTRSSKITSGSITLCQLLYVKG